jgi:hypothetical protein
VGGEISARKQLGTPAGLSALAQAPTVQFKLDEMPPAAPMGPTGQRAPITARHPTLGGAAVTAAEPPVRRPTPAARDGLRLTPPPESLRRTPPPDGARRTPPPSLRDSGRRPTLDALNGPDSKNKLRKVLPQTRLTPSTAFDAVEADFFAREADLYKQEDVESFDDLDRSGGGGGAYRPGARPAPKKKR